MSVCLAGWLAGWLPGWLAGRLAGWQAGRLAGWQAGRLAGWLAGCLRTCLPACLSVCPSVRRSAWNNSARTGRIFMKFCLRIFRKYIENIQVSLKSDNNSGYFTYKPL
jgi:hypothetical protein